MYILSVLDTGMRDILITCSFLESGFFRGRESCNLGQFAMAFIWGVKDFCSERRDRTELEETPPTHTNGSVQGAHVMSE